MQNIWCSFAEYIYDPLEIRVFLRRSKIHLYYILLVLWEPTHGRRGRGRPSATFIDTLKRDLGTDDKLELEVCMTNQEDWRARRAARLRPP